ncbi:unnamed protein product [Linum trigynum]
MPSPERGQERWICCSPSHRLYGLLFRRRRCEDLVVDSVTHSPSRTQNTIRRLPLPLDSRSGTMKIPRAVALSSSRGQIWCVSVSLSRQFSLRLDSKSGVITVSPNSLQPANNPKEEAPQIETTTSPLQAAIKGCHHHCRASVDTQRPISSFGRATRDKVAGGGRSLLFLPHCQSIPSPALLRSLVR